MHSSPKSERRGALPGRAATPCTVVVSGLPRSGTSLVMQMLDAGGLAVVSDGRRRPDDDNPRGYYEHEAVRSLERESAWLAGMAGGAVKIVAPLLRHLPAGPRYRVILLERALEEVLASQRAMLTRRVERGEIAAPAAAEDEALLREAFERQLARCRSWLDGREDVEWLALSHAGLIARPRAAALRLARFLDAGLDVEAMAAVVEPALHRQRGRRECSGPAS